MKRILILATLLLCAASLSAQDAEKIISIIETKASRNIDNPFTEVRVSADQSKTVNLSGQLVFKPEGYLSMDYDNGEKFLIDGNTLKIAKNGKNQVFDTSKNQMMRGLSHLLIYAFQGKLKELSNEQQTTLLVSKEGSQYVAILAAEKKSSRGYSRAIFRYDANTLCIQSMELVEFTGAKTSYAL